MRLFGFEITRVKPEAKELSPVHGGGFWSQVHEPYPGAWQRNAPEIVDNKGLTAFACVFACVSLRANDVAKLRIKLIQQQASGVWTEITNSPFVPVLRKPNGYQTRQQFICQWMTSKLLTGNSYILKERDARGIVTGMHVLDARAVVPMVSDEGSVYYQLNRDHLAGVTDPILIGASEIIHDRAITFWHPLIGISPLHACGASATQGIRIQQNSQTFFANQSRPSGQLTAPGAISEETAQRLKTAFEANFSGVNLGRLLVTGDGLRYEAIGIPAADAQLIEQLRFTIEDVARAFNVPLYKLGGQPTTTFTNAHVLNSDYYTQCLQNDLEGIELLLFEGLNLPNDYAVEFDVDQLLRMDASARSEAFAKSVGAGYLAPNEARLKENLPPVPGGESPYLQQQNWPLAALADRAPPDTTKATDQRFERFMRRIARGLAA